MGWDESEQSEFKPWGPVSRKTPCKSRLWGRAMGCFWVLSQLAMGQSFHLCLIFLICMVVR